MNIGFLGAGKVGFTLGRYFADGGLDVKGYYSRNPASAEEAAEFTGSVAFNSIEDLINECDIIFLTVPDGSIRRVYEQLAGYEIKGKTICHCSGAMSAADAFGDIGRLGAFGYSVHPLFAVSDKYNAYRELTDVFFTLEGCGPENNPEETALRLQQLKKLIKSLGNPAEIIDGSAKTSYHLAAAFASNLVCGLIDESLDIMQRCGFTRETALRALKPILMGNMEHIAGRGPAASLTGPVERNDEDTVRKHLECLEEGPEKEIYRLLSKRLVKMAQQRHPDRDYAGMNEMLGKGERNN